MRRTPLRGSGPHEPAVLVHGLGGNSLNWVDLADGTGRPARLRVGRPPRVRREWATGRRGLFDRGAHPCGRGDDRGVVPGRAGAPVRQLDGWARSRCRWPARRADLVRTLCLISPALPDLRPRRTSAHIPVMAVPGVGNALFDRYLRVGSDRRVRATFELCFADPSRLHPQRLAEAAGGGSAARLAALDPRRLRRVHPGADGDVPGPHRRAALGPGPSGRGADPAGVRAPGQAGRPEGGAPGDQGVPGRARDGHPGLRATWR